MPQIVKFRLFKTFSKFEKHFLEFQNIVHWFFEVSLLGLSSNLPMHISVQYVALVSYSLFCILP